MKVHISPFWVQKGGSDLGEYEDSFWPKRTGEKERSRLRLAIADGASEALLSRRWADVLVRSYIASRSRDFARVYERALLSWQEAYASYLDDRQARGRPIQWYEEPGLKRGAFATFLGVSLTSSRDGASGKWTAVAVGDSCLFHVRGDQLMAAFPLERSAQFDVTPELVRSKPQRPEAIVESAVAGHGAWHVDDSFYLATDALASWFLSSVEAGGQPWRGLADLDTEAAPDFSDWVGELRSSRAMRNDDVTLLRIDVLPP
jgi:hypothetical protein